MNWLNLIVEFQICKSKIISDLKVYTYSKELYYIFKIENLASIKYLHFLNQKIHFFQHFFVERVN